MLKRDDLKGREEVESSVKRQPDHPGVNIRHKTPAFGSELGPSLPLSSHTSFVSRSIQKVGGPEGPPQRVEIHSGGTDIWGRGA